MLRIVSNSVRRLAHTLPNLPYEYNALEPVISDEVMRLHHQKHHAGYVNNYNAAETKLKDAVDKGDMNAILSLEPSLQFNGGGHINHSVFWTNLSPQGGGTPSGDVLSALMEKYGSFDSFKSFFSEKAVGIQGSGWCWLGYCPRTRKIKVRTCSNQDSLQATIGYVPLLGFDVWEHAYYLQYKNARADYVKALWNIINWKNVAERLQQAHMQFS